MSVNELCKVISANHVDTDMNQLVTGVAYDNRRINPGDAFVAFTGQRVDGHAFVEEAFHRGASVAIVSKPVKTEQGPVLIVDDPLRAIQRLARWERDQFGGPVVGITGSNGKTTTKQMVAAVLEANGPCLYTHANQNNELGLPMTILQRNSEHRAIVLEMGMRGFGEIATLSDIAKPTIGLITNIGQSHIERLGSQAGIAEAKGELLASLTVDGHAVLNADDEWLRKIVGKSKAPIVWYGFHADAHVRASQVVWTETGMQFETTIASERALISIPTFGLHNVSNALGALAVGHIVGLSLNDMMHRFQHIQELDGRLRMLQGVRDIRIVDDCYNASPLSMMASLQVLQNLSGTGQRVAILGDMFELGGMSEEGHRQVGRYAGTLGIKTLICVGKAATWIAAEAAKSGVDHVHVADTVAEAIHGLEQWIPAGSTVLIKASRGMNLERIVAALNAETASQ